MLGFRLHRHQQWEFLLLSHLLCGLQLGFGDVMCIDACYPQSGSMDAHHDGERLGTRLSKHGFEHPHDEFLRRVIVVMEKDAPQAGALELLLIARLGEDRLARIPLATHSYIVPRASASSASRRQGVGGAGSPTS